MSAPSPNARPHTGARFEATEWTVVLGAAADSSAAALAAMERLCRIYWPAVYAFIRRQGHAPHDAQDLAQDFFARLVEKQSLQHVDRDKGRFRSFLIASLRNFLANARDHAHAAKRGGGANVISIEAEQAERGYFDIADARDTTPEQSFDRQWALTVLDRALKRLEQEQAAAGKATQFARLREFLSHAAEAGYDRAAADLGLKPGTVSVAVYRLRQRYRDLVRAEVAQTLATGDDVDAELAYLLGVL